MVKERKIIFQANGPWKQAGIAILTSSKVDFKPKLVRRDKEGHFLLIKGIITQKEITILTCMCQMSVCPTSLNKYYWT
jgi:hypothetical protein